MFKLQKRELYDPRALNMVIFICLWRTSLQTNVVAKKQKKSFN